MGRQHFNITKQMSIKILEDKHCITVVTSHGSKISEVKRKFSNRHNALEYVTRLWDMRSLGYRVGVGGILSASFLHQLSKEGIVV